MENMPDVNNINKFSFFFILFSQNNSLVFLTIQDTNYTKFFINWLNIPEKKLCYSMQFKVFTLTRFFTATNSTLY